MQTILLLYIAIGALLILVSIPLIRKKVKPNALYGFRVPQTLDNPDVWHPVNVHAGKRMAVAGVITVLAAIGFYFVPGIDLDTYAWACLVAFGLPFSVGMVQSWRYMKSLV
jgi:uncharacterized membrane protein